MIVNPFYHNSVEFWQTYLQPCHLVNVNITRQPHAIQTSLMLQTNLMLRTSLIVQTSLMLHTSLMLQTSLVLQTRLMLKN
jgi:hypothetical protein